jgi:16S rRNA (adenine1518-N6/adenine1519-N6)-dimethyltransferase
LRARGISAKKRLGQNFLIDEGAARKIADLCVAGGLPILEVGPGTGALTAALSEAGGDVTAIDVDPDMIAVLRERGDLAGVRIVQADALTFDYGAWAAGRAWCAAGNLPYNIATPLILNWIAGPASPDRVVVMVQRDVADRFTARANTPAYGSLSVALQYAVDVKRAFVLGPRAFYPAPNVDSAVVVMHKRERPPVDVGDPQFFLKVVRGAFAYRRKTLANSLALALAIPRERTQGALGTLGHATEIRAEQLELRDFAAIADALAG